MKSLASFTMQGEKQAVVVTAVSGVLSLLLMPLSYLSVAAIGLVTLRVGTGNGIRVLAWSAIAMAILSYVLVQSFIPALAYALLLWLPVWIISVRLRISALLTMSMIHAAAVALLFAVALDLLMGEPAIWWQDILGQSLQIVLQDLPEANDSIAEINQLVSVLAPIMNSVIAVTLFIHIGGGVLLARWWQSMLYNLGGFGREFREFRLGTAVSWFAVIIMLLLTTVDGVSILLHLALLTGMLLVLQGVAVIHALVFIHNASKFWLLGLYLTMLFALPQIVFLLFLAGFIDNWFDFRAFWQARKGSKDA